MLQGIAALIITLFCRGCTL